MLDRAPTLDGHPLKTPDTRGRHSALLQIWLSPSFPIGGFAYSHGLEKTVELAWISDRATLQGWLLDLIEHGSLRNDLVLLAATWRSATSGDIAALTSIAELAAALQPSAERYLEATQQGQSFLVQIEAAWAPRTPSFSVITDGAIATLPIALGYSAAAHDIDLGDTLRAYSIAFIGTLTSAAIRLSVIGQTDAQRITSELLSAILRTAEWAQSTTVDDLGAAAWRSDIASMQHETQHTRLFRS